MARRKQTDAGLVLARGYGRGDLAKAGAWRDGYNPAKGLTVQQAVWLMDSYSRGTVSELMWLFAAPYMGIETKDPIYLAIIERRVAAIRRMDWSVRISDEDAGNRDAARQKAVLEAAYNRIDNLGAAVEALEMARFRGFAHLAITPRELKVVQPWNVQRDGSRGGWRYNPDAQDCGWAALGPEMDMRPEDHITREVARPIGPVALVKWLRCQLSERDWDAFVEIYGLPAWLIFGPPDIPSDKADEYKEAAEKVARGGSGYLPNGSTAQCADAPRNTAPFEARLEYLNKMLVIAGTGGMLTMLAEAGSGTLAGNAHADAFETLAQMDAAEISECFQRQFDRRILERAGLLGPWERPRAWFTLDYKTEPDVGETVQHIGTLAAAGYQVDPAQVAEMTGYQVTLKPQADAYGLPNVWTNRAAVPAATVTAAAPAVPAEPAPTGAAADLARAMQRDLRPVAKALKAALDKRDFAGLRKKLDNALPQCGTESAGVLETAMKKAGAEFLPEKGEEGAE